ncbi:RNA polymerase-associated protein Rtf1-like [Harmonia axyridis]|uniref:RNA polymerase-associated protein Rtf1-like n=1 Tax=Harmonia axyridis TaxID=115357 RepID=UPI001E27982B|nr:RNA polymerase-associated protein Rtf1-like [Harmonia axyridis]
MMSELENQVNPGSEDWSMDNVGEFGSSSDADSSSGEETARIDEVKQASNDSEVAKDENDEMKEDLKKLRIKIKIIRTAKKTTYEIVRRSDDRDELKENTLPREDTRKRKRGKTKTKKKEKFIQNPHNFAMEKRTYEQEKKLAIAKGDFDRANQLDISLVELQLRACHLDEVMTSTIFSIAHINDRNRRRNIEEAEKAIMEEHAANNGKEVYDPFNRRPIRPAPGVVSKSPPQPKPVGPVRETPRPERRVLVPKRTHNLKPYERH